MTTTTDSAPQPANVIAAIARVMSEIGGIEKLTAAERQRRGMSTEQGISYAYRGIDQIAAQAQPLFGKHGVVIVPTVLDQSLTKILKGNNSNLETTPWYRQHVEVRWDIYGPAGVDDHIFAVTVGMADDNSDKGVNKAMTTAFKNLLLRLLCIGDPQDDTDTHRPRQEQPLTPEEEAEAARRDAAIELFERIKAAEKPVKDAVAALAQEHGKKVSVPALTADPAWFQVVLGTVEAGMTAVPAEAEPPRPDAAEPGFPPSERVRLQEWVRASPENLEAYHAATGQLGYFDGQKKNRVAVKDLTDEQVEAVLVAVLGAGDEEPF